MSRTIAIGDIHGCSIALQALIEAISPQPDDTIIPLGDYVDRGIDSKGVLDQLILESCRSYFETDTHIFLHAKVRHIILRNRSRHSKKQKKPSSQGMTRARSLLREPTCLRPQVHFGTNKRNPFRENLASTALLKAM